MAGTDSAGGKWQEVLCRVIGFNMESNGESMMGCPGERHDQIFILEISLWLQCGNWFVAKTNQGAGLWIRR